MDNKKLMQILLHDVRELEMFVEELKQPGDFDKMDRELLLTRIAGVRHLLEFASGYQEPHVEIIPTVEIRELEPVITIEKPPDSNVSKKPAEIAEEKKLINKSEEIRAKETKTVKEKTETFKEVKQEKGEFDFPGEMELDDVKPDLHEIQTLGDKFIAGKSVNDLLLEKGKGDSRFTNLPITNLGTAITTNDKFLFIRELFEGNAEEYNETVRKMDSMANIHEAAAFLRENFKWKKNETSHKFIDLVKRRFIQ